jgi:hypothetical protein
MKRIVVKIFSKNKKCPLTEQEAALKIGQFRFMEKYISGCMTDIH